MKQLQRKAWSKGISSAALATGLLVSILAGPAFAQNSTQAASAVNQPTQNQTSQNQGVPRLVRFSGVVKDADGNVPSGDVLLTFNLYEQQEGGSPLWSENQTVQLTKNGRYSVLLGATQQDGLPRELFTSNQARWIAVQPGLAGVNEQPRVLLAGAPYAIKAGDAETLGGLPASAYMLASSAVVNSQSQAPTTNAVSNSNSTSASVSGTGTTDFLPLWTNSTTLGNSVLFQSGSGSSAKVGVNTTTPASTLDIGGGSTVRGMLNLPPSGVANKTTGKNSQPLDLSASAFNSSTNGAKNQTFQWMAEPAGNDTSSPSASLNLLFGGNGTTATETGLSIAANGQINFAQGQIFPASGVSSLNSLTGAVTLAAGTNVTITPNGNTLTIASTGTGSGSIVTNSTLMGAGTTASPLGVANPLTLTGSSTNGLITATNANSDAVVGTSSLGDGVNGNTTASVKSGVYGSSSNTAGFGVFGRNTASGSTGYLGGNTIGISAVAKISTSIEENWYRDDATAL